MKNVVFDAGALIALERRDGRILGVLDALERAKVCAYVPAGVVAQVWRGSPRQHAVAALLRSKALRVDVLTEALALRIGVLLAATRTRDVVDAHVALLTRSLGAVVLTSDPEDMRRLDASLDIAAL
ncbi:MAG: PIN domain-containing protein [Archangium sp.]|nr:PIN domain-containing protein [Archangium sp.]